MARLSLIGSALLALLVVACGTTLVVPQTVEPTPQATAAPVPTQVAPSPFPKPAEAAPERTFTDVGDVGHLSGDHGIAGKAIVAGLQTLIIQGFTFDGKGSAADIRLVKGQDYETPAAVLTVLESRAYDREMLLFVIPNQVTPETADRIVVYAPETGEVYAETTFD